MKKKRFKIRVLLLLIFLVLVGVLGGVLFLWWGSSETFRDFKIIPAPDPVGERISKMSLEEKVGRLFVVGVLGEELGLKNEEFLKEHHFNAFLLGQGNIKNEGQVKELIASLEKIATDSALIGVDQEGGEVSRIEFGGIDLRSQAKIRDSEEAYEVGRNRGKVLADLGVKIIFAPVIEVVWDNESYINRQERAFLGDEKKVFELGEAMIEGYGNEGVICVGKHFPGGLGWVGVNPHESLPTLDISREELERDIWPFRKLIEGNKIKAIMMTHILYSQVDSKWPASLSEKIIGGILREELEFEGVVVTDDLAMKAVTENYSIDEAVREAFLAGADLMIITGGRANQSQAYEAIFKAVEDGEIAEERVDESVRRIIGFKNKRLKE